jgi:hypothetical protein
MACGKPDGVWWLLTFSDAILRVGNERPIRRISTVCVVRSDSLHFAPNGWFSPHLRALGLPHSLSAFAVDHGVALMYVASRDAVYRVDLMYGQRQGNASTAPAVAAARAPTSGLLLSPACTVLAHCEVEALDVGRLICVY